MGWRILSIEHAGKLRLEKNQIVFETGQELKSVPIEDIECVLLEHAQVELTHPLLSALAEAGVLLVCTDEKHQASGVLLSFWNQYKKLEVLERQFSVGQVLKKRLWQKIVTQKIRNQALCLCKLKKEGASEMENLSLKVQSGDAGNTEGHAGASYFRFLFADDEPYFVRQQHYDGNISLVNASLNYCYALMRAVLTRHIAAAGLIPYLGVHHASARNAFNLADDLIEAFRPMADWHVFQYITTIKKCDEESLPLEIRKELQKIFIYQVRIDDEWIKFPAACRKVCHLLIQAYEHNTADTLFLPQEWRQK